MTIALLLFLPVPAAAASQDCRDQRTQVEMNRCAAIEHAKVDDELNRIYAEYRSRLGEAHKRRLADAQLAWIKFRDLSCAFESSGVEGGSAHPFVLHSCLAAMTHARLEQLRLLANCQEGDLSCPAWK